jgi:hypothetical protein
MPGETKQQSAGKKRRLNVGVPVPTKKEKLDDHDPFLNETADDDMPSRDATTAGTAAPSTVPPEDPRFKEAVRERIDAIRSLSRQYEEQFWRLADELQFRHESRRRSSRGGVNRQITPAKYYLTEKDPFQDLVAAHAAAMREEGEEEEEVAEDRVPLFEDVETTVLDLQKGSRAVDREELRLWRKGEPGRLPAREAGEEAAAWLSSRDMDGVDGGGALASLCGRNGRLFVRRARVVLGSGRANIDLDLTHAGPLDPAASGKKLALLTLDAEGTFHVRGEGAEVFVNGRTVGKGKAAPLPHLSLLELGGQQLLFVVNLAAISRFQERQVARAPAAGAAAAAGTPMSPGPQPMGGLAAAIAAAGASGAHAAHAAAGAGMGGGAATPSGMMGHTPLSTPGGPSPMM